MSSDLPAKFLDKGPRRLDDASDPRRQWLITFAVSGTKGKWESGVGILAVNQGKHVKPPVTDQAPHVHPAHNDPVGPPFPISLRLTISSAHLYGIRGQKISFSAVSASRPD